jgi:hypothetical protein
MPEPIFMKLGMYVMVPEPISAAYFINPTHQSVCLYVYTYSRYRCQATALLTEPLQSATIEELLDALFSVRSVLYQRDVFGSVCVSPFRR